MKAQIKVITARFRLPTSLLARWSSHLLLGALAISVWGCAGTPRGQDDGGMSIDFARVPEVTTQAPKGVVAAAHPLAVAAGTKVLRANGTAMDAAVAVAATLGLVEPQSSGLGGGGFLLYYDAQNGKLSAYDGREVAPAKARADQFLMANGQPMPFRSAARSGRAIGVPGLVAMLAKAHARHGALDWSLLFEDSIRLAENGFLITPRLEALIKRAPELADHPTSKAYFFDKNGQPKTAGTRLINTEYADTLYALKAMGPPAFYRGRVAEDIVAASLKAKLGSVMSETDLAQYKAHQRRPVCEPYRQWILCVPPPPSGGIFLLELMGILEHTDIDTRGPQDPQAWVLFAEASRLMNADRNAYHADPAFADVPQDILLSNRFLKKRARAIGPRAAETVPPAMIKTRTTPPKDKDTGTTHFVIVDRYGNVASLTASVEYLFGSTVMAAGMMLNNQLTDFSFVPDQDGVPVPNRLEPGKRPRSSMSPVVVFDRRGNFVSALGSPGGSAIPIYVAKALVAHLDWGLDLKTAFDLHNVIGRGDTVAIETDTMRRDVFEGLKRYGFDLKAVTFEESGLHGITARDGSLVGAADKRREGTVGYVTAAPSGR